MFPKAGQAKGQNMQTEIRSGKVIELVKDMINIPTINPPGDNYKRFIEFIAPELASIGLEVKIIETDPAFPIIVGWLNRGAKPELHFSGHYDVVPADGNWISPPFEAIEKDGKIYGRGTADMKGGIASIFGAIDSIVRAKVPLDGSISLSLVPDEETGGRNGTEKLIQTDIIHPSMVIIPEPSFPRINTGHKGVVQLIVKVLGASAHASMPTYGGQNSFEQMVKLASAIIENWNIDNGIVGAYRHLYPNGIDPRFLPTFTLGGICFSGNAINTVPGQSAFSIDRRITPQENLSDVSKSLEDFINQSGYKCEINIENSVEPSEMSHEEGATLLEPLQSAIQSVLGERAPEIVSAGRLDTSFFRKRWNIPCVAYGPGEGGVAHVSNEFVRIDRMIQVSRIFCQLIQSVIGK